MEYALKRCAKCGELKTLDQFHKYKKSKDGLQSYCKDCDWDRVKLHYHSNKESWKKRRIRWNNDHPGAVHAHSILNHAVKKGIIIRPKHCTICGDEKQIAAHHPDYNQPYSVMWVCTSCHIKISKENQNDATL